MSERLNPGYTPELIRWLTERSRLNLIYHFRDELSKLRHGTKIDVTPGKCRKLKEYGIIIPFHQGRQGHGFKLAPGVGKLILSDPPFEQIPLSR